MAISRQGNRLVLLTPVCKPFASATAIQGQLHAQLDFRATLGHRGRIVCYFPQVSGLELEAHEDWHSVRIMGFWLRSQQDSNLRIRLRRPLADRLRHRGDLRKGRWKDCSAGISIVYLS
jgi:hypothetical protein